MAEHKCAECGFRKKYDDNSRSFLGRLWRWHTGWCPGWKAYMASLPAEERRAKALQYDLKKFLDV